MSSGIRALTPDATVKLLFLVLLLATLACSARPLLELPLQIGRNHNEGWNAYHAAAVLGDAPLYHERDELISTTYPPLSFLIVGGLAGRDGDTLRTGRVVALLALLVVAWGAGWIAAGMTGSASAGWLAGLLVLGTMTAHFPNYVAMNDPQMLGHAFQLVGLALFVRMGRRRVALLASILFLLAGGLVKHNLLPIPLSIGAWLFLRRRQDFWIWLVLALSLAGVSVVALRVSLGPALLSGILGQPHVFEFQLLPLSLMRWFLPITPLLIAGAISRFLPGRDARESLILLIACSTLALALPLSMARGMNYNSIFDLVFALCILSGIAFARLGEVDARLDGRELRWLQPAFLVLCVSTTLLATPLRAYRGYEEWTERAAAQETAREDLDFVRGQAGAAMCEDPSVCYWADKSFDVDLFNLSQKLFSGHDDGRELLERISGRQFSVIQLDGPNGSSNLTDAMNRAIQEQYELARSSSVSGYFYRPRPHPSSP